MGTVLWSHIEGDSVRELYQRLTRRARAGRPVRFTYRCDSPRERRTFLMTIQADASQGVDFLTELIRTESRPSVRLLEQTTERDAGFVRVCAWCQRVATGPTEWFEVEEAVDRLGLLHARRLPGITHGMCEDCGTRFTQILGR